MLRLVSMLLKHNFEGWFLFRNVSNNLLVSNLKCVHHSHSGVAKVEMNKACIQLHRDQHDGCCFTNILDMVTPSGSKKDGKWHPANLKLGNTAYCGIHKKQCLGFSFEMKSTKYSCGIYASCAPIPTVSPPALRCTISFSKEDLALVGAPCILFSSQQASNESNKISINIHIMYIYFLDLNKSIYIYIYRHVYTSKNEQHLYIYII